MSTKKGYITEEVFNEYKNEQQLLVGKLSEQMQMQNKKNKRVIIFILIFSLVFSGITSVASYSLGASSVGFTPRDSNWNVSNTQEAIDSLFDSVGSSLVGSIYSYMGIITPPGYLACDGSTYNIDDYPRLANHINVNFGSVNYFGGDGETTFAVPDLRGEFLRGTGNTGGSVGQHQGDGLPNITGYQNTWVDIGRGDGVGAFYRVDDGTDYVGTNTASGTRYNRLAFDASRSNKIYGAATEVRPKNTSVLYIIKY